MAGQEEVEAGWAERLRRVERWHYREKIALLTALRDRFGPEVLAVVDEVTAERAQRYGGLIA